MRTAVAKKTEGSGAQPKPDFTTLRIYQNDGDDISDLAALLGLTAADAYQQHVAPVVKKLLKERLQERLKKMQ